MYLLVRAQVFTLQNGDYSGFSIAYCAANCAVSEGNRADITMCDVQINALVKELIVIDSYCVRILVLKKICLNMQSKIWALELYANCEIFKIL